MSDPAPFFGGAHQIDGTVFPSEFSYANTLSNIDLLKLYKQNEFIEISVDWMSYEAFRQKVRFVEDETVLWEKFGKPYSFKGYDDNGKLVSGFDEYLNWIEFWQEFHLAVSWSRLYPEGALMVFLDKAPVPLPQKNNSMLEPKPVAGWPASPDPQGYLGCITFQPNNVGADIGFYVEEGDYDPVTNVIKQFHLQVKDRTFLIAADRCIHMIWRKKQNGWAGTSRVQSFAHVALNEEQILKRLGKRMNDLAGGILTIDVTSKKEMDDLDAALGPDLTSTDRIYKQPGHEITYATPDLKAAGEYSAIEELLTRKLCRHIRISQLMLDGENTGSSLGGPNSSNPQIMSTYTEMYQMQEHYRKSLESAFYKLGKKDTRFSYNPLLPEEMNPLGQETQTPFGDSDGDPDESNPDQPPTRNNQPQRSDV